MQSMDGSDGSSFLVRMMMVVQKQELYWKVGMMARAFVVGVVVVGGGGGAQQNPDRL
jgi:hypothetical protein